jgi:hypothetical protein
MERDHCPEQGVTQRPGRACLAADDEKQTAYTLFDAIDIKE